jgi:hypothetical protein
MTLILKNCKFIRAKKLYSLSLGGLAILLKGIARITKVKEESTMADSKKDQQSLVEYEREKLGEEKKIDEFKDQGRVPDQQNRLKDQENLRK